jgi:hypothetical protein
MTEQQPSAWVKPGIERIGAARRAESGKDVIAPVETAFTSPSGPT